MLFRSAAVNASREATLRSNDQRYAFDAWQKARAELGDVKADVDKVRNGDVYKNQLQAIKNYTLAKAGNKNAANIAPAIQDDYNRAMEYLYGKGGTQDKPTGGIEGQLQSRIDDAQTHVNVARANFEAAGKPENVKAVKESSAPKGEPTAPLSNFRTGANAAPTAAPPAASTTAPAPAPVQPVAPQGTLDEQLVAARNRLAKANAENDVPGKQAAIKLINNLLQLQKQQ